MKKNTNSININIYEYYVVLGRYISDQKSNYGIVTFNL